MSTNSWVIRKCDCCGFDMDLTIDTDGGYKCLMDSNTGVDMCLECGQIYFIDSTYTDIETLNQVRTDLDMEETTNEEVLDKRLEYMSQGSKLSKEEILHNWISLLESKNSSDFTVH